MTPADRGLVFNPPDNFGSFLLEHVPGRGSQLRAFGSGLTALLLGAIGLSFAIPAALGEKPAGVAEDSQHLWFGVAMLILMLVVGAYLLGHWWSNRGFCVRQYHGGLAVFRKGRVETVHLSEIASVLETTIIPKAHVSKLPVVGDVPLGARYRYQIRLRDSRAVDIDAGAFKLGQSIGGFLRNHAAEQGYEYKVKRIA